MNYILLPSLQNAAVIRIAALVYNNREIKSMVKGGSTADMDDQWQRIQIKIAEKLSSVLPSPLQQAVAKVIRPMHDQVEEWIRNHDFLLKHLGKCCSDWLLWKTDGTIDRTETAKRIVRNEKIDPTTRFVLACTYFFEDDVLALSKRIKRTGRRKNRLKSELTNSSVRFFMGWLKKKDTKHWSEMVQEHFRLQDWSPGDISLRVSCFFPFLSTKMRQEVLEHLGKSSVHADDFFVCVNKMDETERIEAFKLDYPLGLVFCLRWPYRSVFSKLTKEVFNHLTFRKFVTLLRWILNSYIYYGHEDYHLFEEFWQNSPAAFKEEAKQSDSLIRSIEEYLDVFACPQALKDIVRKCYLD